MIPKQCKRLAEVDFPIARVSAHSAREKSIRRGHPSTLHLWWARRPLAACRSMLMALLLPDPCDPHCPAEFRKRARAILSTPAETGTALMSIGSKDEDLRKGLLDFIADFANWDNSSHPAYLKASRALVKAAHGDEAPLVVDPFAGGGSNPLEALRIGCDAFASDLNPVACLINKVMLEDIPRHGPKLAEELRRVGAELKKQAEKELAEYYPPDPDGARPIAYLWARTVKCEQPNCGCEIPLIRSFWLSKKANRRRAMRYEVVHKKANRPCVEVKVFSPKSESEVPSGTVSRAKATCPACHKVLAPDRVRAQLREQRGGADVVFDHNDARLGGATLLAVATMQEGEEGREYRGAEVRDYDLVSKAYRELRTRTDGGETHRENGPAPIPNEPLPAQGTLGFRVQLYGMEQWGDLFTSRQKLCLTSLLKIIASLGSCSAGAKDIAGLALSRYTDIFNSLCQWENTKTQVRHLFTRHAVPMLWDFAEPSAFGDQAGDYQVTLSTMAEVIKRAFCSEQTGQARIADACDSPLPDECAGVWFTDPPYYDAVPYSDLSDFFFVWLKRSLPNEAIIKAAESGIDGLTPKVPEIVQDESKRLSDGSTKDKSFFEDRMAVTFCEGRRVLREDGIGSVVFAHKTTEGWEALLGGMIRGGWVITGSWPITTELGNRLRARDSAALAASIHLVCRPRDEDAGVGDWGEIIRELPKRIADWMERLGNEGIHGADLVFACIGPALELFSRYERVETPDGEEVGLAANDKARGEPARRGFLSYVWEVAGRTALNQVLGPASRDGKGAESKARNGAAGALEEDARLTALFLWTLQSTETVANDDQNRARQEADEDDDAEEAENEDAGAGKGKSQTRRGEKKAGLTLIYDVARRFAQPLGIHLDAWEGRIIETAKGIVRLLPVHERAKQLFGEEGASAAVRKFEHSRKPDPQMMLGFMAEARAASVPEVKGRGRKKAGADVDVESLKARQQATTLDRVHAAMLLQSGGASNALRALLEAETQRGPDFLRLANALSALYPRDSEEKRLLDAMLLAVPR